MMTMSAEPSLLQTLHLLLVQRILVLDGAMGTMIQQYNLSEEDVRTERFRGHHKDLIRFADILCLTNPRKITDIHRKYLDAGADIVETNTFGASSVGMEEFELPRACILQTGSRFQNTNQTLHRRYDCGCDARCGLAG